MTDDVQKQSVGVSSLRPRRKVATRPGVTLCRPEDLPAFVARRRSNAPTRDPSKPRIFAYTRFSTDRQEEKSEERQLTEIKAYARKVGGHIVGIFSDRGISGTTFEARPQLIAMLEGVTRNECDIVVIENVDRLSRRIADLFRIYDHIQAKGLELHDVSIGRLDRAHVLVMGYNGEEGRVRMLALSKNGKRNAVRKGLMMQKPAYGFKTKKGDPGVHVVDERAAGVVVRIYEWVGCGMSANEIARKLSADRLPSPAQELNAEANEVVLNPKTWHPTTVLNIIRNPIYIGWVMWGRSAPQWDHVLRKRTGTVPMDESEWIVVSMPEFRLVDDAVWAAAQDRCAVVPRGDVAHRATYLLTGLIVCGACGERMVVHRSVSEPTRYACQGRALRGEAYCSHSSTPRLDFIEDAVIAAVFEGLVTPEAARRYEATLRSQLGGMLAAIGDRRARIARELSDIDAKLYRSFCEDDMKGLDAQRIARFRGDLERTAEDLSDELSRLPRPEDVLSRLGGLDTLRAGIGRMLAEVPFRPSDPEGTALKGAFRDVVSQVTIMPPDGDETTRIRICVDLTPRGLPSETGGEMTVEPLVLDATVDHREAVRVERVALANASSAGLSAAAEDGRHDLSDAEWLVVAPFFEGYSSKAHEPRTLFDGLICFAREGGFWRKMPERFGGRNFVWAARSFVSSGRFDLAIAALREAGSACVADIDLVCFDKTMFQRRAPKRAPDPVRAERERKELLAHERRFGVGTRNALRCRAVALTIEGKRIPGTAKMLGLSDSYVRKLWHAYCRDGVEAVLPPKRKLRISEEQLDEIIAIARGGVDPRAPGRILTIGALASICSERFGAHYSFFGMRNVLRQEGVKLGEIAASKRTERRKIKSHANERSAARSPEKLASRIAGRAIARMGKKPAVAVKRQRNG